MKRIILFAALALGLASCSKDNLGSGTDIKNSPIFTADIVYEGNRTQIDIVEEDSKKIGKVTWTFDEAAGERDTVIITDNAAVSAMYHIVALNEKGRATFAPVDDQQPVLGDGPYTATYGDIDNQVYDPKHLGSNCPMEGVSEDSEEGFPHLNFRNTAAVISVKVHSDGAILKYVSAAGKELKLSPNVNITKETTFDIAIPAGTYEEGVELKFRCINGIVQKRTTKTITLARNQLHPVRITKGLDFDMDPLEGHFTINEDGDYVRFAPGNVVMNTDGYDCAFEVEQFYFHTAAKMKNDDDYVCDALGIHKNPNNLKGLFKWPATSEQREEVERTFPGWDLLINGKDNDPTDKAEWKYLTMLRSTVCTNNEALNDARYTFIVIKDIFIYNDKEQEMEIAGMILFPDSFAWPEDVDAPDSRYINYYTAAGTWNSRSRYSIEQFKKMENAGIVFLPAGGRLNENDGPKTQNTNFAKNGSKLVLNKDYAMGSYMTNLYESDTYFKFSHCMPKFTEDGGKYGRSIRFVVRYEAD